MQIQNDYLYIFRLLLNAIMTFIVSNPQVKQHCYFNQFIAINDNRTSNLPSIYGKEEGERDREKRLEEREK